MHAHHRTARYALAIGLGLGCGTNGSGDGARPNEEPPDRLPLPPTTTTIGLVHHGADGNRILDATGPTSETDWVDVPLDAAPQAVVGVATPDGPVWAVATTAGAVEGVRLSESMASTFTLSGTASATQPPVLALVDGEPELANARAPAIARSIAVLDDGTIAYLTEDSVVVGDTTLPADPLPDAKLLVDTNDRLLFVTGPTPRYSHAVLGDGIEGSGFALVTTDADPPTLTTWDFDPADVLEGTAPLWVDLDGDGSREIIATLSNATDGARLVAFNEQGQALAQSEPIGLGFRWRHQLAAGPFRRPGERTIIAVRTPHIGGPVELFSYRGDRLGVAVETVTEHTSHRIGSPNLDQAVAWDFDDNGDLELLIPSRDARFIGVHQVTDAGVEVIASLPLAAELTSNLAAVGTPSGVALAAGTGDGLRIFVPGPE